MENNIDLYGFYKRSNGQFIRWNNNNPATLRQIVSMKHEVQYMASDVINIEMESVAPITDCVIGDYIIHAGSKFRINQTPPVTKTSERHFKYSFTFESVKYELINVTFLLVGSNGNPLNNISRDDFTGTMAEFLNLVVNNANRVYPNQWTVANPLSAVMPSDAQTLSFDGQNCLYVLQNICETWGEGVGKYEYVISENQQGVKTIDIVERDKTSQNDIFDIEDSNQQHHPFEYGKGKGLYEIKRNAVSTENLLTKMFAFGSSENLPTHYFNTRLGLAKARNANNGTPYRDGNNVLHYTQGGKNDSFINTTTGGANPSQTFGIREGVVNFDEIKPHATFHISRVGTITAGSDFYIYISQASGEPTMFDLNAKWGNSDADKIEYLKLSNLSAVGNVLSGYTANVEGTYKYISTGETIAITFTSGDLSGMQFNVVASGDGLDYNHGLLRLKLKHNEDPDAFDPDTGTTAPLFYPNSTIKPQVGDSFVFTGIQLPWSYVERAERELLSAAQSKFDDVSQPQASYSVKLSNDFIVEHYGSQLSTNYGTHEEDILQCGKYMWVKDTDIGINHKIRITQYSRDLIKGYEYDVTVSDFLPRRKTTSLHASTEIGTTATVAVETENPIGNNGITLDMEFTCAGDTSNLHYACINSQLLSGTLRSRDFGRNWTINNSSQPLAYDKEYNIYISLNSGTQSSGSVYVREAWLRSKATEKGKIFEITNNRNEVTSYLIWAGKVSRIAYTVEATHPYRTVEMWIGRARNETVEFIGSKIKDVDGNLSINLASGSTEFVLGNLGSVGLHFTPTGLKMKKAKMQSEDDESTVACFRGDFNENATYNEGDQVRVQIDDTNFATFRCLVDGVRQQNPPDEDDTNWVALSATSVGGGGGGGVTDYDDLNNRPKWNDSTGDPTVGEGTFTGTTYFKTVNGESIIGNGNIEWHSTVSINVINNELKITDTGSIVTVNGNSLVFTIQ